MIAPRQWALQITCVVSDPTDPGNRIKRLGAPGWVKNEDTVIEEIEEGQSYVVDVDGALVPILVVERYGDRYLRTDPVQTIDNKLLSLPPCHS